MQFFTLSQKNQKRSKNIIQLHNRHFLNSWKIITNCSWFWHGLLKKHLWYQKNLEWQALYVLNPANHIEFSSVIWKSDKDPRCILLNSNPFEPKPSSTSVCFNWESLCSKIVLARLQSSGVRLKYENISSIKTAHAKKTLWIVLSWICNIYASWHHYGRQLFHQWSESHCLYLFENKIA